MDSSFAPSSVPLSKRDAFLALAIFCLVLGLFVRSPVITMGDSKYTLLLTESLLKRGSFVLDGYDLPRQPPSLEYGVQFDGRIYQLEYVDGHLYNFFPPGTAILCAPFVLVGDALGHSVFDGNPHYSEDREGDLQVAIASFLMAGLAVVFYLTARCLLPVGWSAAVALGAAFGTQMWSTASRALWNHTWGIALLGSALGLLLARETGRGRLRPVLLATILSWTYFVRPTNSIFIVGITVYLLIYHRAIFLWYAATGAAWFGAFVAWSWAHFGKLLPNYYGAGRLDTANFREALAGNLISPSRGTLIFVPVVLFVVYLLARHWWRLSFRPLAILALVMCAGHLLAVSCFSPWFGGWCYGPRYTTEWVPWLVLLAVLGLHAARTRREDYRIAPPHPAEWPGTVAVGGVLLLAGVFIHYRGANVVATAQWNETPVVIDDEPGRVWRWRDAQFLTGLLPPPLPATFPRLAVGQRVAFGQERGRAFEFDGWSGSDQETCWTQAHRARLIFATDDLSADRLRLAFAPYIHKPAIHKQRIAIRLNDRLLAEWTAHDPDAREYVFGLPPGLLQRRNELTFTLPDAASPQSVGENDDDRTLGIALRWLELKSPP